MTILKKIYAGVHKKFQIPLRENIFFLHVPKCGGTSLDHSIRSSYGTRKVRNYANLEHLDPAAATKAAKIQDKNSSTYDVVYEDYFILKFRESLLLYFMSQNNLKFISGHFSFSDIAYNEFKNRYAFITILRDPIKRFISVYFFNRYKKKPHCKIEMDAPTFLSSEIGKAQGCTYVKMFGGIKRSGDYVSPEAIEHAKSNLDKFTIVGAIEYQDDFLRNFRERFGVSLQFDVKNKGPKPDSFKNSIITKEIEESIREISKPDLEIYDYVLNKYIKNK